jgi:UDP-glucose 4-epimerase
MIGITHVLHLAAQVSVPASVADPLGSSQHNIQGFLKLIDAARRAKVSRFVYASSAAVYGAPEELPLTEESPALPLSPYGLEKYINDQYAALYSALRPPRSACVTSTCTDRARTRPRPMPG